MWIEIVCHNSLVTVVSPGRRSGTNASLKYVTVELQYDGQPLSGAKKSGILELSAFFGPFFLLYEKNDCQGKVGYRSVRLF